MAASSARVHILLARDAALGVVIRRGPSKQVATIGWNRDTDQFTIGQWLKGRIYERRSDLSPDGKHLIYFAMNGKWHSEAKGSWTAISRAPYLKAIGLWAKGDCWHGGGVFIDDAKYWLNNGYGHQQLSIPPGLKEDHLPLSGGVGSECLGVYFPRLIRDGWKLIGKSTKSTKAASRSWVFERPATCGWLLRKHSATGLEHDTHELVNAASGTSIDGSAWEWADIDRQRIAWSESGKLYAARLTTAGLVDACELYDFNSMRFEAREAPY